jgi:hypothetical protein
MKRISCRLLGSNVLLLVVACGGKQGAPARSADETSAAGGTSGSEAQGPSEGAAGATGSESSSADAKGGFDPIAICSKMCDAIAKKCGEAKEQVCRATCTEKYDVVPDACADQTRQAFDCGRTAEDLLCSSFVPPSCSPKFDALASCATLGNSDKETEYKAPVPSGWKRVEDKKAGFAVWMPPGAKSEEQPAGHAWVVTDTDGVQYRALVFSAPAGKTPEAILKTAAGTFLGDCGKGLKLRGRWDKGEEIGIVFAGKCKDGTGWRGVMRMVKGTVYALGLLAKSDKDGSHDGFAYSFEYLKK